MLYREAIKKAPKDIGRYPVIYNGIVYAMTQRKNIFICSVDDFDLVKDHKITERSDFGYVEFYIKHRSVKLNKLIAERIAPVGYIIDHKDGVRLNYHRSNLRPAMIKDNARNRRGCVGKSGFVGVKEICYKAHTTYEARLWADSTFLCLGAFDTPEEAARARDIAALFYHGSFARLNFFEEELSDTG